MDVKEIEVTCTLKYYKTCSIPADWNNDKISNWVDNLDSDEFTLTLTPSIMDVEWEYN